MTGETRASLILRLGDPADDLAWTEFLEIYEPMLFRIAQKWGLQDADAREVVQETLLGVSKSIHRFRADNQDASFRRWLSTITRHKLADHLSESSKHVRGSGDSNVHRWLDERASETESVWDWNHKREVFAWASKQVQSQVNESTWAAFHRTCVDGESIHSVAKDLGMRPGLVYVARSRVMRRLRKTVRFWSHAVDTPDSLGSGGGDEM